MANKFIIYQLMLRVFGNTNPNCVPGGSLHLNGTGKFSNVSSSVLESIKRLAVTHIWYTGVIEHVTKSSFEEYGIRRDNPSVIKGEAGSPYAIKDYYDVNPYLANSVPDRMAEFEDLLSRTHSAGLKAIIDFIPNHLAREYSSDSLPAERSYNPYLLSKNYPPESFGETDNKSIAFSPQNNFYYLWDQELDLSEINGGDCREENCFYEKPAKATGNDCFSARPGANDWYETVKLNYGVDYCGGGAKHFEPRPKTWDMMLDILLFWAAKGVDGFRCDMAEMVPVEFWHWAISAVKRIYPNVVFIAEVYNPSLYHSYIEYGGFDYLYDKVGLYDNLKYITQGHCPAHSITNSWQSIGDLQYSMLNFLENHDEQRVASDFNIGDPFKALPELAVSLMLNTAPFMLYFGQEFGERGMLSEGFSGVDGRTSIFDYCSAPSVVRYLNTLSVEGIDGCQLSDDEKQLLSDGNCNNVSDHLLSLRERELYKVYRHLFTLTMSEDALRSGSTYDVEYANFSTPGFDPGCCYAFARRGKDSIIIIAADFTQTRTSLPVNLPAHLFDFWKISPGHYSTQDLALLPAQAFTEFNQSYITQLLPDSTVYVQFNKYGIAILKIFV